MHGTTMMFLFAVPVMQGLGDLFRPADGRRAQHRVSAAGRVQLLDVPVRRHLSLRVVPAERRARTSAGSAIRRWRSRSTRRASARTSGRSSSRSPRSPSLAVAVSLITTVFKLRAPGMTLNRMPIFVWAQVVTSFMVIFAMPAVMLASTALILDRLVNTHFFDVEQGGDALLWQHLFWFFGHPEVYIIFIPGSGIVSTIVDDLLAPARCSATSRSCCRWSSTAFMGFGLWVHHMFATGLPQLGESFFTAASMMIAIPTGMQIFCWIATMWSGRSSLKTPMLWVLGFFVDLRHRRPDRRDAGGGPARTRRCTTRSSSSRTSTTC